MAAKLTKPQRDVMNYLNKGWKAYCSYGTEVEINGRKICKTATMETLERLGLIEKIGVAAWQATEAGREWREVPLAEAAAPNS